MYAHHLHLTILKIKSNKIENRLNVILKSWLIDDVDYDDVVLIKKKTRTTTSIERKYTSSHIIIIKKKIERAIKTIENEIRINTSFVSVKEGIFLKTLMYSMLFLGYPCWLLFAYLIHDNAKRQFSNTPCDAQETDFFFVVTMNMSYYIHVDLFL